MELHELLALIVHDVQAAARAKDQHLALTVEPVTIHADVDELGILIRNLVDNAIRYTPRRGRIAVSCHLEERGGKRIARVCVADDGAGVPPHERPRILDRFYRGSNAGECAMGSGIGLSLVARIATGHHAALRLSDGIDGRGLAVSVEFPASRPGLAVASHSSN